MNTGREVGNLADTLARLSELLDSLAGMDDSPDTRVAVSSAVEQIKALYERATAIRREQMEQAKENRKLSLAQLGKEWDMSKARADQILRQREQKKDARWRALKESARRISEDVRDDDNRG